MHESRQLDLLDYRPVWSAERGDLTPLSRRIPCTLHLGTSSWSFPGWAGLVYDRPADRRTLARHGLSAYAHHPIMNLAGIDRSFYGPLPVTTWRAYAEQVPQGFRFLVKAPGSATVPHWYGRGRSNPYYLDPGPAADAIADIHTGLGDKLAGVVYQFPPLHGFDGKRFAERLHRFLLALPSGSLVATEIRSPRCLGPSYAAALRDVGAVHCFTVHPRMPSPSRQLTALGSRPPGPLIARWNLGHGQDYGRARARYAPFDRIVDPDPTARLELAAAVAAAVDHGQQAYVSVNNKAEGSAPLSAEALAAAIVEYRASQA